MMSELVEGWVLPFSTLAKILEYYGIGLLATSSEGKKRIGMYSDSDPLPIYHHVYVCVHHQRSKDRLSTQCSPSKGS